MSTIGETIADVVAEVLPVCNEWAADICAALGVPADTSLANLVALQDGQYVVERRVTRDGELYLQGTAEHPVKAFRYEDSGICDWVVVREAVSVRAESEGEQP